MHNRVFIFSLFLISFAFAIFSGGKLLYFLLYEFALIIAINYIYVVYVKKSVSVDISSYRNEISVGSSIVYDVNIINNSIIPVLHMNLKEGLPENIKSESKEIFLMPFRNKKIKSSFIIKKRGIYTIGPFTMEISDPFGIFKVKKVFNIYLKFTVMPKVYDIYLDLPAKQQIGNIETKNKAFEDYTNISRMRKYMSGDSLKRIHWKITAKKRELYVKEYEMSASSEIYVLWNLYKNHYLEDTNGMLDESCAECMLSVVKFCLLNNIPVNLMDYSSGKVKLRGKTIKDFKAFKLASLKNYPIYTESLREFLRTCSKNVPYDVAVILITPYLDNEDLNEILNLKVNRDLIVYYVNKDVGIGEKLRKININVIPWGNSYGQGYVGEKSV